MTISTAFTNDNGSNDNDVADAHAVQVNFILHVLFHIPHICYSY
jgi:hypothetical protein